MGFPYFIGDAIAQQFSKKWDSRRSCTFILFGIISGNMWGRAVNQFYPYVLKLLHLKNRHWMIVLEGALFVPLIYYPTLYLTQDFSRYNNISVLRLWEKYVANIQADWLAWSKF